MFAISYCVGAMKTNIVLAEEAVEQKFNEIKAIPMLLELLAIRGRSISIDASSIKKKL